MSLLFRVLHAVHARGTHPKLVLDSIERLGCDKAEAWQRVFLKHWDVLLQGSKDPDNTFKDFTNHVLHPRDNWWGGAPKKARSWYGHLVEALRKQDWATAVYSAGVLSHYLTDPVQPFHTAQSEAENSIHRAFEWSISNSYGALVKMTGEEQRRRLVVPNTANWLETMLVEAVGEANTHYEKLIAHFDIHRAVVDPPAGLDIVSRRILAGLLELATAMTATVIERAIAEAAAEPPEVSLALDTFLATIKVPAGMWARRLENAEDRRLVEAIYDELKSTGTVEKNLPEDERVVRAAHAAEVVAKRKAADPSAVVAYVPEPAAETTVERRERQRRAASKPIPEKHVAPVVFDRSQPEALPQDPPRPAPQAQDQAAPAAPVPRVRTMAEALAAVKVPPAEPAGPRAVETRVVAPVAATVHAATNGANDVARSGPRLYLTRQHDIVDAPSIGPKMAERLLPLGLKTVDDLLAADPRIVSTSLALSGITPDTVRDWQAQALLVCTVPGLRGTHAQLLVGAGYRTAEAVADADVDSFCARVLAFAATPDGHRVLRNGDPPDVERIKSWLENARSLKAA